MRRSAGVLSAFVLGLSLAHAAAQAPTGMYRIAGTVVSAVDGHPLQRAEIHLRQGQIGTNAPRTSTDIQTATSDEGGRFAFSGVPAGMFNLQGSAPGYLNTAYEQHGPFSTGIVTGAGVDTESLVLKLEPEGRVAFTVVDETGEPVEQANIHLFRLSNESGEERRVSAGSGSTNDLGRHEFPTLQPGTYFAAVEAQPWYAVHPNPQLAQMRGQGGLPFGFVESIDPSVDVAYPITYYPGATDPARAAPIQVRGGDTTELQLQLRPEPALTVTVPAPPMPTQPPRGPGGAPGPPPNLGQMPQVFATVFDQRIGVPGRNSRVGDQFVISGLARGDYTLSETRMPNAGGGTPLHLSDHSVSATLPSAAEVAHITVQLKFADGSSMPSRGQIILVRTGETEGRLVQVINEKGTASFEAPPGDYYFNAFAGGRRVYVRQVLRGEQPLASNNLHLTAGESASYTITVASGTHTLRGITQRDGKPAHGISILLVPTAELYDIRTAFRYQTDLDGSFQIPGLPTGDYTLLAIDDGWDLDWRSPSVLKQYLTDAPTVRIAEGSSGVQTLPAPVVVQSR